MRRVLFVALGLLILLSCKTGPIPSDASAPDASAPKLGTVGGSGTGLAQDATLQQIAHLYGAAIPVGGSGTGLAQDATLQQLYSLIHASGVGQVTIGPSYFVDPVAGNDANNCTAVGTPCKTWRQIRTLWGLSPTITQATTVKFLSSQTNASDPVDLTGIKHAKGGTLAVYADLPTAAVTGTLSSVTAINRNISQRWMMTDNTHGAGFFQAYNDYFVEFAAHNANAAAAAWIVSGVDANATLSTPIQQILITDGPGTYPHARVTIDAGTAYSIYMPRQIFLGGVLNWGVADGTAYQDEWIKLFHLRAIAVAGFETIPIISLGRANICLHESRFDNYLTFYSYEEDGPQSENSAFIGGFAIEGSQGTIFWAGYQRNLLQAIGGKIGIDGDFLSLGSGPSVSNGGCGIGYWGIFSSGAATFNPEAYVVLNAQFDPAGTFQLWGTTGAGVGFDVGQSSRFEIQGDPATVLTLSGPGGNFTLGQSATADSYDTARSRIIPQLTCSVANLKAQGNGMMMNMQQHAIIYTNPAIGTALVPYQNVTAGGTITLSKSQTEAHVTCAAGTATVNMDAAPFIGELALIYDVTGACSAANTITVSGNGKNVESATTPGTFAATFVSTTKGSSLTYEYTSAGSWKLR